MNRRFGVLLRHYWIPATELTYEQTEDGVTRSFTRTMGKCDSDVCVWRQEGLLHIYNRSEQTYRTREILGFTEIPEDENEARNNAFLHVPVLTPLLPIPLGFQWHVASENGYMNFTLDSLHDDTAIISRNGIFSGRERNGVTAIAVERSVILEDRYHDRFGDGTEIRGSLKLIESRLNQ